MVDIINVLLQDNGREVIWDYCLENNIIMPDLDMPNRFMNLLNGPPVVKGRKSNTERYHRMINRSNSWSRSYSGGDFGFNSTLSTCFSR